MIGSGPGVVVALAVTLLALVINLPVLESPPLDIEDAAWMRGDFNRFQNRVLQVVLMRDILRPWAGHQVGLPFLFATLLHAGCALLLGGLLLRLGTRLRREATLPSWRWRVAGLVTALAFVIYRPRCLTFLSALSYQMFTAATLGTLLLALASLNCRRAGPLQLVYWGLACACCAVAVFSHSYGLGLPLVVGLLEAIWRRSRLMVGGWPSLLVRHAVLASGPLLFALLYLPTFTTEIRPASRLLLRLAHPRLLAADLLQFCYLIELTIYDYIDRTPWLFGQFDALLPGVDLHWNTTRLAVLACLGGLSALGLWQLATRGRPGIGAAFLLMVVGLNLVTLHQTVFDGLGGYVRWRFYHSVAGLCLLGGALLATTPLPWANRLFAARWLGRSMVVVLALGLPALVVLSDDGYRGNLGRLVSGQSSLSRDLRWAYRRRCVSRHAVELSRVKTAARQGLDLTCADLRGMDLSKADLRGVELTGADMSGATLTDARLDGANLRGAALTWAVLTRASARGADLRDAHLIGANLSHCDVTDAHLERIQVAGATIHGWHWQGKSEQELEALVRQKAR